MKKIRNIAWALFAVLCMIALAGCDGENPPEETKYTVTLAESEDYALTADKTEGVFGDKITVSVNLRTSEKKLIAVTCRSGDDTTSALRTGDTTFSFILTKNVTVSALLEEYTEALATDTTSRPFAAFSSSNTKTLVPDTGSVGLYLPLNASYMTILNLHITSSDPSVIPEDAFSYENSFQSQSNIIIGTTIRIDTSKITTGTSWVTIDLTNGNSSSQKGTITVRLTVAETIEVGTWTETVIFDITGLPEAYKDRDFYIAFSDQNYIEGMNVEETLVFEGKKAENGKISVTITYAVGHNYRISFGIPNDETPADSVWFGLLESVSSGSTATGFNQYKDGLLSFIQEGVTLTVVAVAG